MTAEASPAPPALYGKDRVIYDAAMARGLEVLQVSQGWHIRGPGVDLHARHLAYIDRRDLLPARPGRNDRD